MINKSSVFQCLYCCAHTELKKQVWQAGLTSLPTSGAACSVTCLLPTLRKNKKPLTYLRLPKDPSQ